MMVKNLEMHYAFKNLDDALLAEKGDRAGRGEVYRGV